MSNSEAYITSVQYSTWKICTHIGENYNVKFSKDLICTLGQLAFDEIGVLAEDLELFSKHAKRTTINCEDVKLLVRRIPNLHEYIDEICQKNSKQKKKDDKRKRVDFDDDSKDGECATTSKARKISKKKQMPADETSNM